MLSPKQIRLRRRLLLHHLPLFAICVLSAALLYVTRPYKDVMTKISFATAYPAMLLLAATLLIGPWNLLRGKRQPISSDLRRDIGIWGGMLSLVHTAVGQNVHLRGRPWLYYVYEHRERHLVPLRHDLFGLANHTGLVSALVLLALLATSNDYSLRALGTPRWKQLQRWNYLAFALAGFHAIAYQRGIESQAVPWVAAIAGSMLIVLGFQLLGYQRRRSRIMLR